MTNSPIGGSFRDPCCFVFGGDDGQIYRQVNQQGREDFDHLMQSGLYDQLVKKQCLIPHRDVEIPAPKPKIAYRVIQPEQIPFISYPYEWCFQQLKDAALLTLKIQRTALRYKLSLKDASAYNIQFYQGKPIWIDTLSFETYHEGEPWTAYRQFCQHFLAPLALTAYSKIHLLHLLREHLDGLPLELTSALLPYSSRLNPSISMHIHLHARVKQKYSHQALDRQSVDRRKMSQTGMLGLIDSLEGCVEKLKWEPAESTWSDYYEDIHYSTAAMESKTRLVQEYLEIIQPKTVWDLGANTGYFSRLAAQMKALTMAMDSDPLAVELNYRECKKSREANLLPVVMDLTNPSPAIGWENQERSSLMERAPADAVMALALFHHLAIGNNLSFDQLAGFLSKLGKWLMIEFIPTGDPQIRKMLAFRKDIFPDYQINSFERAFSDFFSIQRSDSLVESQRVLYLMEARQTNIEFF
jgi:ribosomal protein L11 methylase PrmA